MCYNNKSYFYTSKRVSYYLSVPKRTGNRSRRVALKIRLVSYHGELDN